MMDVVIPVDGVGGDVIVASCSSEPARAANALPPAAVA